MELWQEIVGLMFVVAFTLAAAISDFKAHRLPNVLTVPAFAGGLLFHMICGATASGWTGLIGNWQETGLLFSLAGFGTGFGILLVLWLTGGGGGGDVKFMGALGAWLGVVLIVQVFLIGTLFVIIGSIGVMVRQSLRSGMSGARRKLLSRSEGKQRGSKTDPAGKQRRRLVPFAVPIALATWVVEGLHWIYG